MPITCRVYGLGLEVNVPIAGLAGLPSTAAVDVRVRIGELPGDLGPDRHYYSSQYRDEFGEPTVQAYAARDGRHHRIAYSDGTTVIVDAIGSSVWMHGPETATVEDTATYLLGPILGFVLRLRGTTCLHASAVVIDGCAVALLGASGAGKSSTAAAFAQLGFPVLTDDVLALSESPTGFLVQPAYPRVRLWNASVEAMFGAADALPLITPNWEKRFLDLGELALFCLDARPLAAIFILDERTEADAPQLSEPGQRDAMMALVTESYVSYLLDPVRRAQEFAVLARVLAGTPIRSINPCADFARIPDLCKTIVAEFRRLRVAA